MFIRNPRSDCCHT